MHVECSTLVCKFRVVIGGAHLWQGGDDRAAGAAAAGKANGDNFRSAAESLRMLVDGAAAVRPATEAEEAIKRKEKLVLEKLNSQVACPPFE